ncbi:MAG TPA: ABC transporter permease [Candidatus Angelobacter sp.]
MAIPLSYNLRSMKERWVSAAVAILGITGTVGVFVATVSIYLGFKATLVASGSADNAIILRSGSTNEMDSQVDLDQVHVIQDAPGVARSASGPLVSPEVVVVRNFPMRATGTDANVQVRGVSPQALEVRKQVKISEGRIFQAGLYELVVGRSAANTYTGLEFGNSVKFGGAIWKVVGIMDSGGSAFDSEVWADSHVLNQVYHYPADLSRSVTVHLTSPQALQALKDALTSDPRMHVAVTPEVEYYGNQSLRMRKMIMWLGGAVVIIMGVGAIFGALSTMYSAVAERGREIATMRALGFGGMSVVTSFVLESLLLSLIGGLIGCVAVLPLNGFTASTMNMQTFSHLAFAFKITPALLGVGVAFALLMGFFGGVFPAARAARRPVAAALRSL